MLNYLITIIFICSTNASAQDWFDVEKPREEQDSENKGLLTYAPSIRVPVPNTSELKGKTLRVDGISYPLQSFIDLPGVYGSEEVDIEIVAEDNRILDYQYRTVSEDMLRDFAVRRFQFEIAGGYRVTDNEKWKDAGIRPSGNIVSFAAHYFPAAYGLRFGLQRVRRSGKNTGGQLVEYEVSEMPLLVGYDLVPLADSSDWRQWQIRLLAGIVFGSHSYKTHVDQLADDGEGNINVVDSGEKLTAKTNGIHLGFAAMRPVTDRVWLSGEYGLIHRSLSFKEISFLTEKPIHDFKIGLYFSL